MGGGVTLVFSEERERGGGGGEKNKQFITVWVGSYFLYAAVQSEAAKYEY